MRSLAHALPEVAAVLGDLSTAVEDGSIDSTDDFADSCRRRWDDALVARVDVTVPGWQKMASFADGKTLWHINIAMVALYRLDEYLAAPPEVRRLMEWTILLHDIGKEPAHDRRDHRHAFRSAADAAPVLPGLGFPTGAAYATDYARWRDVVYAAWTDDPEEGEPVPDNAYLPEITGGINRMFEADGARLLTAIALHQSVTVVADWPSLAPLTEAQENEYITPGVAELQRPLMLADSGGWNLFDPATLGSMYEETRAVFARIAAQRT